MRKKKSGASPKLSRPTRPPAVMSAAETTCSDERTIPVVTPVVSLVVTLVVVELGAEWPARIAEAAPSRRVLAQLEGETPAAFSERVASGVDGVFGRGLALGVIALACNERTDAVAEAARRKMLGIALGSMAAGRSGKAYLAAPPHSSGRLRHALSSLARGLHDEWRTAGLEVSVDFGEERASAPESTAFTLTARVA